MNDTERTFLQFPPASPGFIPSTLPFFVVGIGASAGGIDALLRFFEAMPADSGMAFVIVLHLSPKYESNVAQILQAKTKMPVMQVNETVAIEPNHVYIIPPSKDLLMNDGTLQVISAARPSGRHTAIDLFLRTLAEVHRERAVGVILSGSGSDGAVGIARIKEKGGITLVQSPDDAGYDSMPRSAIATGAVDLSLPVAEMPQKLITLFHNANSLELPPIGNPEQKLGTRKAEAHTEDSEKVLMDIMAMLEERTGHDFRHYKRATVLRRIERRMQVNGLPDLMAYRKFLEQHQDETTALLQDMLISVTNFFRDRDAFAALEHDVIPKIFEDTPEGEQIRAWSLGCATGEEAYSLAMLLADRNVLMSKPRSVQIFASDIDERAINIARHGSYPESIIADVSPSRLRQYFDKDEQHYRVKRDIREQVLFALHNVLRDPPFSKLNLIACRNLLIYLNRDIQNRVIEILHYALRPHGYLFLGSAESVDPASRFFVPIDKKHRIYQAANVRPGSFNAVPSSLGPSERLLPVKASKIRSGQHRTSPQEVHHRLLEDYAPPSILIDENNDVVYATRQAGRFLHYPGGETSNNILTTIHPDLQLELRAALFQASQSHQKVTTGYIAISEGRKSTSVRIVICPAQDQHAATGITLLAFEELGEPIEGQVAIPSSDNNSLARHLEEELKQTKEQLRSVVDQYEVALEDVKASNEELQAINEELRSTTKEMETSKEELQSTNEELITVNLEMKMKVDETAKANDDLQNFISATEIAVVFIDRGMRIKRYTRPSTKIFNLIATDIDRSLLDITHRLEYPAIAQDIEQVFEKLQPVEREVRSADGLWYIAKLLPYRTAEDRIEGVVLSFIDISKRKLVEQRLQESEQRMRLIAASTRDYAIATMDMDGIVTSWNNGAERLFGYSEKEMLGQRGEVLYTPEDRTAGALQDELDRARKDGRAEDDRWHVRKDGSRVFCSGITSPLIDEKICGFVKIARDLTSSKRIRDQQEARLAWERQERIRAEEAARVRDEFFAVLSHELKQPLNLIQLTAEMLSRLPETEKLPTVARSATTIKRMVDSQARIIDDLMDLSRLHTGKLTLACTQVNLNEAVSHVVNLMSGDAQQKDIALVFEQAAKELIVHGDMVRIEQVVWNLLSNALKFTPAGGKVYVRLRREGDNACIEVADTGKGIPPEFLPFIFDMFRQANTGTTRQYGGLGIGLALVKQLVNSHGGRVEVDSRGDGQGTQFRVFLPVTLPKQKISAPPLAEGNRTLAGKRVLLVDDAKETLESLGNLLGMEGANVSCASSGAEALKIVTSASEPYQLIISDIGMPDMDGYTLLAELRKVKATETAPAIALSGFTRPADVACALAAGFETHVRKPIVFDQFIATAARLSS
jgi:two-component system CheB/CheR fusion protein